VCGRMEGPIQIVVLAQGRGGHVCRAQADGRELEAASRELLEGDPACRNLIDRARDLIDRSSEVPIVHLDDGLSGLADVVQDPFVLDLELGVVLGLCAYLLPVGVVLP